MGRIGAQLSGLERRLSAVNDTISQVDAAAGVGSQVQLALDQVRTQLNAIRTALLADEDQQTLTAQQRTAKQAEIDTAITQINNLAATDVNGRKLLSGSADFSSSGRNISQIRGLLVFSSTSPTTIISGIVSQDATQSTLTYTGASGAATNAATFTLAVRCGATTITGNASDPLTDVVDAINKYSHQTGVTASVSGDNLTFTTADFGIKATIAVSGTSGTFNVTGGNGDGTTQGTDAVATINGQAVSSVDGNVITVNQSGLHLQIELTSGFSGALNNFTVSDQDVLKFALSTDVSKISSLAIAGVQAGRFVGVSGSLDQLASGGTLAGLASNVPQAIRVVDEALARLTLIDGQVDGFTDVTVKSSADLLGSSTSTLTSTVKSSLEDALTSLNGVDTTEENLLLTKNLALVVNAQSALSVLQQQRSSVLLILKQIAGFI